MNPQVPVLPDHKYALKLKEWLSNIMFDVVPY